MDKQIVYTVGGTVQAGGGIYIKRKADDELLILCKKGEWASILSSRQVGKSSLMVRTAQELEKENVCSVIVDLSAIGVNVSPEQWYLGILSEIANGLELKTNIFEWWQEHKQLGPAQRFVTSFRDLLLNEVEAPIVLFFDEIDSTLSMPFSRDDFFAALRAIYNSRSTNPIFLRLSVVLVGVATPSDLIMDSKRTPYNIGRLVELTDFTLEEAQPLSVGLGISGEEVLKWIFQWTGGHPYLTQLVCFYMAKSGEAFTKEAVQDSIETLFKGEQGRQDNNLRFVSDMLTKRAPDLQRLIKTYKDIRSGKRIFDDEHSTVKAHLKISGIVRRLDGMLVLRNRIYEDTFDLKWIKENTPSQISNRVLIVSSFLFVVVIIVVVLTGQLNRFIYLPLSMDWVNIPKGEFLMGSNNSPEEEPIHMVNVDSFDIGVYEVTNEQYTQCVKAGVCTAPFNGESNLREVARHPVTDVTWFNASQFCTWVDPTGRLPTEAEWEKAARGTDGRLYPWGENSDKTFANFNLFIGSTTPVGTYERGRSPYGIYDMAGNVAEWVIDWYDPDYYSVSPLINPSGPETPETGELRVIRGGSWIDDEDLIRSSARNTTAPLNTFPNIGFRCARSE